MNMSDCVCPYCRALLADDRPPAHFIDQRPTVRELALQATQRAVAQAADAADGRRRARRYPAGHRRTLNRMTT